MVVPVDVDGPYRHRRQRDVREQQRRARRCVDRRVGADVETILLDFSQRVHVVIPDDQSLVLRRVAQKLHELGDTWADDEPRAPAQRQTRYRPRQAAIIEAIKTRARGLTTLETRFETVVGVPLWNAFLEVLTYDEILRDCDVVRRALTRAGIDSAFKGAHLLRHSLATSMLRNGASLEDIGQILRHRHPETTQIYAKVDLDALRALAPPWPGGAA